MKRQNDNTSPGCPVTLAIHVDMETYPLTLYTVNRCYTSYVFQFLVGNVSGGWADKVGGGGNTAMGGCRYIAGFIKIICFPAILAFLRPYTFIVLALLTLLLLFVASAAPAITHFGC